MGKKSRQQRRVANGEHKLPQVDAVPATAANKRRILFAAGDADFGYTEGKIWRLTARVKEQTGWNVVAYTQDDEALHAARKLMLNLELVTINSPGVTVMERLRATDEMIRETSHVVIPGSRLPLWKVLAMDDFLCSLQLFGAQPSIPMEADAIVVPIMCIDNNTKGSCGLYTWMISEARRNSIPVIALEVSPLGNKNTLAHLPADHYAVKTESSRDFLVREGLARPAQVSVMRWEESYCLWAGNDDYTEAYLEREAEARKMLNIPWDRFTVVIPHHVAFLWEVRKILEALAQVDIPLSVVIRVDPRTTRRQFPERELVMETYGKEIRALPHVVIDERIGVGLLLQLADLVITPFSGTANERAALCRKPTIICQAMAQEGWRGEFTYWEPRPENIPELIRSWRDKGALQRTRLARIIETQIEKSAQAVTQSSLRSESQLAKVELQEDPAYEL
jgi:hypothetical protein